MANEVTKIRPCQNHSRATKDAGSESDELEACLLQAETLKIAKASKRIGD